MHTIDLVLGFIAWLGRENWDIWTGWECHGQQITVKHPTVWRIEVSRTHTDLIASLASVI